MRPLGAKSMAHAGSSVRKVLGDVDLIVLIKSSVTLNPFLATSIEGLMT